MKKLIVTLMAVLFLGATTGMVFAQGTTGGTMKPASTSKAKGHKGGKKKSHTKKSKSTGSTSAAAGTK